jgi:LCP family protein required for cell wall assembly
MNQPTKGRYEGRFAAPKQPKLRRISGGVLALLILVLGLSRLGAEAFKLLTYADLFISGRRMLIYGEIQKTDLSFPEVLPNEGVLDPDDGTTVHYNGHSYRLNPDLTTVLVLGIDQHIEETEIIGTGGQSDVVLLVGIDTKTGRTTVLNISRETYAQVDVYSVSGINTGTEPLQLTLAYAYGDGKHGSCQNALRSVSRLLYGLPIRSYLALDMDGISALNEAVGGVTVRAMDDLELPNGTKISAGESVELHGRELDLYIRSRPAGIDSNAKRMARQQQYITEFSKLVIDRSRDSLSFPVELFSSVAPYVVTNLDIPDVTFLSSTFLSHGADFRLRNLEGSFGMLGKSAVFYPDETDLFEAVLELFYVQID